MFGRTRRKRGGSGGGSGGGRARRGKTDGKKRGAVPGRGKRYSEAFKGECLAAMAGGKRMEVVAAEKAVSTESLRRWRNAEKEPAKSRPEEGKEAEPSVAETSGSGSSRAPHDNIAGLSDEEIEEILKLKKDHVTMGPAQIRAQLKRFRGWRVNVKAIARVLRAHGYRTEHVSGREEQELQRFEAPRPNALWMMDAMPLRVHEVKLYLHVVLDDFSRFIVGHRVSEEITSEQAVETLREAIALHGKPERVLTDRGGQFAAVRSRTAFGRYLEEELIDHSFSRPYHPQTLGKCESVNRAIQKELIYTQEFVSVEDARAAIAGWVEHYNFHRAHLGIDGLVPADRYFGLHKRVLAVVQAKSRGRAAAAALSVPGSPIEEIGAPMEVLRLALVDGNVELRFCGRRVVLGNPEG